MKTFFANVSIITNQLWCAYVCVHQRYQMTMGQHNNDDITMPNNVVFETRHIEIWRTYMCYLVFIEGMALPIDKK